MNLPPPQSKSDKCQTPPPPPVPQGIVNLEYSGYWILFENSLSRLKIMANDMPLGTFKFREPFQLQIPAVDGQVKLYATLAGIRSAKLNLNIRPGSVERVLLEYNRAWGNIYFTHIPSSTNNI